MTQTDIVKEYWDIYYWELRKAGSKDGAETVQYEGAVEFEEEMASHGLKQINGHWVEIDPDEINFEYDE